MFLLIDAAAVSAATTEAPRALPMVVLGVIMVATYVAIALDWLHKALAAMLGAVAAVLAALAFGLFPLHEGARTHYAHVHHIIGHELGVLGVIIGTSILVDVASHSGLFHFIAVKIVKRTDGDPRRLFLFIALLTVVFVTFLTIAPGTLIVVSLALVVTKALDINPRPYVLSVAIIANSAALTTLASGICTLMLATASQLPYVSFFRVTTPMGFVTAAIAFFVLRRFYGHLITAPGTPQERKEKVEAFDEWALVKDRRVFYRIAFILLLTIVGFATAQNIGIGLDFIAMCGGVAALFFSGHSTEKAIKVVKWDTILFFVGLFVIIGAVESTQLLTTLAGSILSLSGGSALVTMLLFSVFALVMSGLVDNIPIAATMIPIVRTLEAQGLAVDPLWWALILTANLGGNSTPVGSISTVIALSSLEKERGIKVGWGEFLKVGGIILAIQGTVVLAWLVVFHVFDLFPHR
jgi:Na+/H+ antiporter NhaD/arsenite permease-like protein